MFWRKSIYHALAATAMASCTAIVYNYLYSKAWGVNFSAVINIGSIIGASSFGCILMALGYALAMNWKGEKLIPWLNIVYSLLSLLSMIQPLFFRLPLDIPNPELFPALAMPMHLFPVLAFYTVAPFFRE